VTQELRNRWAVHQQEDLFDNGIVQQVGFALDIFKQLETKNQGVDIE